MDGRRIYLLRHGETLYQSEANEGAIGNGALTERGREQIAAAALLFRGVPIDRVYASPLARSHETARIIAKEKGLAERRKSRTLDRVDQVMEKLTEGIASR